MVSTVHGCNMCVYAQTFVHTYVHEYLLCTVTIGDCLHFLVLVEATFTYMCRHNQGHCHSMAVTCVCTYIRISSFHTCMCCLCWWFLLCAVQLLEQECAHVQEDRHRKEKDLQLSSQHLKLTMQAELEKKVWAGGVGREWEVISF